MPNTPDPFAPEPYPFAPWFRQSATLAEANARLADFAHRKTQQLRADKLAQKRRPDTGASREK